MLLDQKVIELIDFVLKQTGNVHHCPAIYRACFFKTTFTNSVRDIAFYVEFGKSFAKICNNEPEKLPVRKAYVTIVAADDLNVFKMIGRRSNDRVLTRSVRPSTETGDVRVTIKSFRIVNLRCCLDVL